jgi:excisionase family DNA binding protein
MEYLIIEETAGLLGVKKSSLYDWIHIGYIPHIKMGKFVRFAKADVLEWFGKVNIRPRNRQTS